MLNCRFEVIFIHKKDIPQQVQQLKATMLDMKEIAEKNGKWNEWKAPLSLNELKDEFKNTLFVKIKSQKKIKNDALKIFTSMITLHCLETNYFLQRNHLQS